MNAPITFNTLAFAKRFETLGMDQRQAEALAEAINEVVFDRIAMKADVNLLRSDLRELEPRLKHELTVRLGAAIAAAIALTVGVLGAVISLH